MIVWWQSCSIKISCDRSFVVYDVHDKSGKQILAGFTLAENESPEAVLARLKQQIELSQKSREAD